MSHPSGAHTVLEVSNNSDSDDSDVFENIPKDITVSEHVKCKFCGKTFSERRECVNHQKTCDKFYVISKKVTLNSSESEPSSSSEVNMVKCKFCSVTFGQRKNCTRHEKMCSANPDSAKSKFNCGYCGYTCNRKDNFKVHVKKCEEKHQPKPSTSGEPSAKVLLNKSSQQKPGRSKTPCLFPDCDQEFFHKCSLIDHLRNSHDNVEVKDPIFKKFDSVKEFHTWKDTEQENTFSYFSQKGGQSASRTKYFYCQHDGSSHSQRKTDRINSKGRVKTGHHCIANMKVWKDSDEKINVKYFPTHNHVCSSQDFHHHPVSKSTDLYINERLSWGVSPTKILRDVLKKNIPKSFTPDQAKDCKAVVLSKKRIRERARKMRERRRYHKDEVKALFLLVNKLCQEEDAIVVYKPYGRKVEIGPKKIDELPDSKELFLLGMQTKRQAQLMADHSHKIVLIDETHGTNHHKYQLLSLMVIDDNRRGWPVAHLVTSKSDADTLQYFFDALKAKLPEELRINCIISDDDPALINGMDMGFKESLLHILCKWHLLKNFRKNLRAHVPLAKVDTMMTELRVLVNETEESMFLKLQEGFIKKYETECSSFIHYYIKNYKHRAKKWAMCYRQFPHANINTTGHLESFHHRLKKVYLKRKVNRRLDDLVHILLDVEWDDHLTRIREATLGMAYQPQEIMSRHKRGMTIEDEDLTGVEENTWSVKASSGKDTYHIVKYTEKCSSDHCFSKCAQIACAGLCSHIYVCSCPDNHPLCKHIHKLHCILTKDIVKQMRDNECSDHSIISHSDQVTLNEPNVPQHQISTSQNQRTVTQDCQDLEENINFLSNLLDSESSKDTNVISHAASVTKELVLQLKYMSEEKAEDIPHVVPAEKFASTATLKTQLSQISSFRKPPAKRKSSNPKGVSPTKKKAVVKDLLDILGNETKDDPGYNFTPSMSFVSNPRNVVLKCDLEKISLLDLKCLELNLSDEELTICMKSDPAFHVGWLCTSVICTFLARLQEKYPSSLALSSDLATRASRGFSNLNVLQRTLGGNQRDVLLFPANLSGVHWCIAAVLIDPQKPQIWYYDPLQNELDTVTVKFLLQISSDMKSLFPSVDDWNEVVYVQAAKQTDSFNCGVHICSFAEQMVKKSHPYQLVKDTLGFRKIIYDLIVGGCLKRPHYDDEVCGTCKKDYSTSEAEENNNDPWIMCIRCDQWFHERCVSQKTRASDFVCPL